MLLRAKRINLCDCKVWSANNGNTVAFGAVVDSVQTLLAFCALALRSVQTRGETAGRM